MHAKTPGAPPVRSPERIPPEEVLPHVGPSMPRKSFLGKSVKMASLRLQCFAVDGLICKACGLKASYFTADRHLDQIHFHLNLYGLTPSGGEVLFTKDHIHPKSKGGLDRIENMQTMCFECNQAKGSNT